jgi:Carboxypeptidase regulatory-like domain
VKRHAISFAVALAGTLVLAGACGQPAQPPVTPANQTTLDDGDPEPAPKPVVPPRVLVELVAAPGLTPGTGTVSGTLADQTGAYIVGVTVVASSPALQGSQTAITDEQGSFDISALPAGRYTITAYYVDLTFEHTAEVADGKITRMRVTNWDTSQQSGEIILIKGH